MIIGQIKQICSTGQVTLARRKPLGRIKPADLSSQESPVKATLFQGACRCTTRGTSRQKKEELRCLRWLWRLHLYYFSLSIHLKSRERGQGLQTGFSDIPVLSCSSGLWLQFLLHSEIWALLKFSCSDTLLTFSRKGRCPAGTAAILKLSRGKEKVLLWTEGLLCAKF